MPSPCPHRLANPHDVPKPLIRRAYSALSGVQEVVHLSEPQFDVVVLLFPPFHRQGEPVVPPERFRRERVRELLNIKVLFESQAEVRSNTLLDVDRILGEGLKDTVLFAFGEPAEKHASALRVFGVTLLVD